VGFTVVDRDGRRLGRVRRAEDETDELIVARRLGRRRVDVAAVDSIWPHEGIILVSDASNGVSAPDRSGAAGDETLPWFDLPGAAPAADEPRKRAPHLIAVRAHEAWTTIRRAIRSGVRATSEAIGRDSRRFRVWVAERIHVTRRRCARGLIRLAAAVEPNPGDADRRYRPEDSTDVDPYLGGAREVEPLESSGAP
jgi:hypothetical protein